MTNGFVRAALFGTAALLLSGTSAFADSYNREVTIHNHSSYDIYYFYGSRTNTSDWEEDILGSDILPAGSSILIDFDDGTGACTFDFKAVFEDGDEAYGWDQNVCRISNFTFTN
jgi:hypothetical protein